MSLIYFMYKIHHPDYSECYVGSTANYNNRKSDHKRNCNDEKNPAHTYKVYQFIRDNGGWDDWTMEQLESFKCETKEERLVREKDLIKEHNACLNKNSPFKTSEEYRIYKAQWIANKRANASEEWRENERKQKNEHRLEHKDELNAKQRERYETDPEWVAKRAEQSKQYRKNDPEKTKARNKANYAKRRDYQLAYVKEHAKKPWHCDLCNKDMTYGAKSNHIKTKKHQKLII